MSDDAYTYTVTLKRGDDKQKCKVTAANIEELAERVDAVREKMAEWAGDYNEIRPDEGQLPDDQSDLSEVGSA